MASYDEVFHETEMLVLAVAKFMNYSEVTKKREEKKKKYDKLTPYEQDTESRKKLIRNMYR